MRLGQFVSAVLVFVVGSLILTLIISPETFYPFKAKVTNVFSNPIIKSSAFSAKSEPANLEDVEIHYQLICAPGTIFTEDGGVFLRNFCSSMCDNKGLSYYSYDCHGDHYITCNCLK